MPEAQEKMRQNYIIAYSMGGLVGRKLDQLFDQDGERPLNLMVGW